MRNTILAALAATLGLAQMAAGAEPTYTLTLKGGKIPKDVTVENANGVLPDASGYMRGWTQDGWTVGQFGDRGNVLLSPTYNAENAECENVLTLPMMEIGEGALLRWDARSVLPDRPESYTVEIRAEGETDWTVLKSVLGEKGFWRTRMAWLDEYFGQRVEMRFVVRTAKGFMLALDNVSVGTPDGPEVICIEDNTDRFHGRHGNNGTVKVTLLNAGTELYGVSCRFEGQERSETWRITPAWYAGEEMTFEFYQDIPQDAEGEVKYTIFCHPDNPDEEYIITEGTIWCSEYKITPLVDEGSGMWCNNCPVGMLEAEKMKHEFGDGIAMVCAHVNDIISSDYFNHLRDLGFYGIPYFMSNRNEKKGNQSLSPTFANLVPASGGTMAIGIDDIALSQDGESISVTASTEGEDGIHGSDSRYRIGYVVTADFHDEGDPLYYQQNSANVVKYDQYYYLPSWIPAPLAYFHDVALTDEGAFDGLEGSMAHPSFTWEIGRPALLEDFSRAKVVAYILDTETGLIMNSTAARVDAFSGVDRMEDESFRPVMKGIYRMDGTKVSLPKESLPSGLYIIDGKKTMI